MLNAWLALLLLAQHAHALTAPPTLAGIDLATSQETHLQLQNQVTVVVFLSARCPCSASHEPKLAELAREYGKEARFVAVHSNSDEPVDESARHFKQVALPFPVIQDTHAQLANHFGALKTPHVYVVAKNGEVLYQGGVDDSHQAGLSKRHYLKDALDELRAGRTPSVTQARSIGCQIRR